MEGRYGVSLRAVCSWMEVYEWLGKHAEFKDHFTSGLVREFLAFLEEHNMNGVSGDDLTVLHEVLTQGVIAKLPPFFLMVRKEVQRRMERLGYKFETEKRRDI